MRGLCRDLCALLFLSLRATGDEPSRVDGFTSIRIPSVVTSNTQALLNYEAGRAANADQARNRIVLKQSTNEDRIRVGADGGERSLNNPCAVVG